MKKIYLLALGLLFSFAINAQDGEPLFELNDKGHFVLEKVIELDENLTEFQVTLLAAVWMENNTEGRIYDFDQKELTEEYLRRTTGVVDRVMNSDVKKKRDDLFYSTSNVKFNNSGVKLTCGKFNYVVTLYYKPGRTKIKIQSAYFYSDSDYAMPLNIARFGETYPSSWPNKFVKKYTKEWNKMRLAVYPEFEEKIASYEAFMTADDYKKHLEAEDEDDW